MQKKYYHWGLFLALLLLLLIAAIGFSLTTGESNLSLFDLAGILQSKSGIEYQILTQLRLPRMLLAFAVGGSLSLAGTLLQGIFRNPLVEPFTLGISGGAAFGVSLAIVMGLQMVWVLPLAGFAGAFCTLFLVYILSLKKEGLSVHRMLLIGVMVSFVCSSAVMFLMSISTAEDLHSIIFWTMGSLDEPNTLLIRMILISSLAVLCLSYLFARPLNALRLGEVKAQHLGINTATTIRILFVLASLLTGLCVSVAGIIGFVGLIIPHIIRQLIGSDYRILLLSSFLGGSIFLMVCDVLSRTLISPNELPIGVITGMAGGLIFILVLSKASSTSKRV